MNFIHIDILWNFLWIIPLYFIILYFASSRKKKMLAQLLGSRADSKLNINVSTSKRKVRNWLLFFTIILLLLALARPYSGYKILPYSAKGRDILIILDTSKSMLAEDTKPSRLAHAKHLIKNLIKDTPGDRYGIISFAGSAFLECPLTEDKTTLFSVLNELNTESIPVGGTNIEKALNQAITAFKAAADQYKAVILVTDGDEIQGNSVNAVEQLKELKIPIFVVGIGNPEQPALIQTANEAGEKSFLRDSKGEFVKTKLNETQLQNIARETNGIYIRSTTQNSGTAILEGKIRSLIPDKFKSSDMTRPVEKFQIPLSAALILFIIWFAVGEYKKNEEK